MKMMRNQINAVSAVILLIGVTACSRSEPAASSAESAAPARIGRAPLSQIGFAVQDVDAAARRWSDVLGVPASDARTVALQLPDASMVEVKVASLALPNTRIELTQPVTERGPVQDHLDNFGPGVHYIGFSVTDDVDALREQLERVGGKWTGGAPKGEYALVDFRERFGVTLKNHSRNTPGLAPGGRGRGGVGDRQVPRLSRWHGGPEL